MIHRNVERKLRRLGLTGCYQGYNCLVYAAILIHQDPSMLELPTKLLYPEVAQRCHLTVNAVDRAIRTAILVCFRRSAPAVSCMCGTTGLPTVQQFLSGLSAYCGGRQR
ncbi:MAG TPA: sporulation initiation factor Spo0A C-terminal domain-containing protein [Candidatus Enterenecus stercoripullorum]|nr:sporulation initiation factor Spo0A C-terminal domain-containing protein [Candidatus Enterenecus stercoripullorum]